MFGISDRYCRQMAAWDYTYEYKLSLQQERTLKYVTNSKYIGTESANRVNEWWETSKGYDKPPYKPNSKVTTIELAEDTTFVRVYDGTNSNMLGNWVMKYDEIAGLSPAEIQNKFALPQTPVYICDVNIPAGTQLRFGVANSVPGWGTGSGIQFDLMGGFLPVDCFYNQRLIQ